MHKTQKRIAFLPFFLLAFTVLFSANVQAVHAPKKHCHAYVVMDAGSGEVLFGQDADKKIYPASTTKLMTAIVCIENGDVDGTIKTKSEAVNNTTPGTYALGIPGGVTFTFKDLLNLSLLSSAADATDSLAVGVFGSKQKCVEAMNEKCGELGLTKTSFDNPVGSDLGAGFTHNYSTATEMAEITRYAMAVPLIRSTVKKESYTTEKGGGITVNTTNWFIRGITWYDDDTYTIIGSKTGTTDAAGHVFIATAMDKEGHEVICAFFGDVSKESTFVSIRSLLKYTFKQVKKGKITLTPSDYDVRNSADLGPVQKEYATLNCYPASKTGAFKPEARMTRKQLAKMIQGVDGLSENQKLNRFSTGNQKGKVTALRLALLVQDLYPVTLSEEEIEETLSGVGGTENLSDAQKLAFAAFLRNGLAATEALKNPSALVTRKSALLFADALSGYQLVYSASHCTGYVNVTKTDGSSGLSPLLINSKWEKALKQQGQEIETEKQRKEEAAKEAATATEAATQGQSEGETTATEAATQTQSEGETTATEAATQARDEGEASSTETSTQAAETTEGSAR